MARPMADLHGPKFLNLGKHGLRVYKGHAGLFVNINGRDSVPIVGTLNPGVLMIWYSLGSNRPSPVLLVVIKRGIKSPSIPYHIFLYFLP